MIRDEGSAGSSRCQDCGNQAKKDCAYLRCRTCCKNRGFECQTHVKSTWIPVSKRHHSTQLLQQFPTIPPRYDLLQPNPKRSRENPSLGLDVRNFPAEVHGPATFRCVRVSSQDNAVDRYAYQTAVSIRGHVFKGILYDQGPDNSCNYAAGESSGGGTAVAQLQNIIDTAAACTPSTSPPPYQRPLSCSFWPGAQYFPFTKP
ncbi:hypothetical protein NMG60_11015483 [Bertholletia excelsa]